MASENDNPTVITPARMSLPRVPSDVENPEILRAYLQNLNNAMQRFADTVHVDLSYGHATWPVLSDSAEPVQSSDAVEGSFMFENDGTRQYVWARNNSTLRLLTNLPQNYIAYATAIQNSATGGWGIETWTFPQGGFKTGTYPTVICTLEGPTAHMQADGYLHTVFNTTPSATAVTFYIDEWYERDPVFIGAGAGPTRVACQTSTVWINAFAIGQAP